MIHSKKKAKNTVSEFTRSGGMNAPDATSSEVRETGTAALSFLLDMSDKDTGQARVVAHFLLNLYNHSRFTFNLPDLRRLDSDLFEKCIEVLRLHSEAPELALCIADGEARFETLASNYAL